MALKDRQDLRHLELHGTRMLLKLQTYQALQEAEQTGKGRGSTDCLKLRRHTLDQLDGHRSNEIFLRRKLIVERWFRDTDTRRQFIHGHGSIPALTHQLMGRLENLLTE